MKPSISASVVFVTLFVSFPAMGQTFSVMGEGNESCGTWIVDREANQASNEQSWVLGFKSGANELGMFASNKSISITTDSNGAFGWIDNYCRANPTKEVVDAAGQFWAYSGTIKKTDPAPVSQ